MPVVRFSHSSDFSPESFSLIKKFPPNVSRTHGNPDLEAEVGRVDEEERLLALPVRVLLVGDLEPLVLQLAREGRQVDPPVDGTSPE